MSEEYMVSFLMEASGKDTEVAWSFNAVSGSGVPRCQSWSTNRRVLGNPLDLTRLWPNHLYAQQSRVAELAWES